MLTGRFITLADARTRADGVLVAMSGGVDSAVTALMVKDAGFRAVGLTMKNYCYGDTEVPDRSCCSVEAIGDAKRECDRVGIPHRVADVEEFFTREVVDDFVGEYKSGRTPNPCVRCNSIVRFDTLIEAADRLGLRYVATGHYARVFLSDDGDYYLARSTNRQKDQSYFLSSVRREFLPRILFPLGELSKDAVRATARTADMKVADKKESQEVCFVPEGTLRSFLESKDVRFVPGPIETAAGERIGTHSGLAAYTVGQRRHIGVSKPTPHYVLEIDREHNRLVVGEKSELDSNALKCRFNWFDSAALAEPADLTAQIRYRHPGATVAGINVSNTEATVYFNAPQSAACPGQTIAFYRDELVCAAGVIERAS